RWLGDPTRSEFTVALPDVVAGEIIFRRLQCSVCHVIDKIPITIPDQTMLSPAFVSRLSNRGGTSFVSYLGTDLLMHDMGYLSQVGYRTAGFRDPTTGVALPTINGLPNNYVQKIRTPALKGLRFNRYVTESQLNTKNACSYSPGRTPCDPG